MSQTLEVGLEQITIGSRLKCPICDPQGILLLAAGHEFTATHRDNIRARGITRVRINSADLDSISGKSSAIRTDSDQRPHDQSLLERRDRQSAVGISDTGWPTGPLKQTAVQHGPRRFDAVHHAHVKSQHVAATRAINQILDSVLAGRSSEAGPVTATADDFLRSLVADISCCLYVAGAKKDLASFSEHSVNVAILGMAIGFEMGLGVDDLRIIGVTGLLEDLGMSLVPDKIKNCPRQLTSIEFLEIQRHTLHTARLLQSVSGLPPRVQLIAYQVHERPDGSGYPRGLSGTRVHPFARILHVADMYTSLVSRRPFRPPLRPYSAMECLIRNAHQGKVDQTVVRHLLAIYSLFPIGSRVKLSDDTIATVIRANGADYTRPIVVRQLAGAGSPETTQGEDIVDLAKSDLKIVDTIPDPASDEQGLTSEVLGWSKRNVGSLAHGLVV